MFTHRETKNTHRPRPRPSATRASPRPSLSDARRRSCSRCVRRRRRERARNASTPAIARRRAVERDGGRRRGRRARASIAGVTLGGVARDSRERIARGVDEGIERSMRRMQTKRSRIVRASCRARARATRAVRRRDVVFDRVRKP